jgi:hypothetical protein
MQMLIEAAMIKPARGNGLMSEANEIIAIVVSSIKTPRDHSKAPQSTIRNPK